MPNFTLPFLAAIFVAAFAPIHSLTAEDWPQFRGPNASGVAAESTKPPVRFSPTEQLGWSIDLGKGVASPIVSRGRVFTTAMSPEGKFVVLALSADKGQEIWKVELETGKLPDIMPPNEHASSTPATDGDRVYVHFSTLGLIALDASNGDVCWKHPLPMPAYLMGWGAANSPIVYQDLVIFNLDDDLQSYLLALDKVTGKVRWKQDRAEMLGGYAVPVVCEANGRSDVVVAGTGKLKGYDPKSGQELWTCNSLLRTIMTTPVVHADRIYLSVQSYGDTDRVLKYALLQWRDTNQDKKLTKDELEPAFHARFDQGDADQDGFLVDDEIDAAFQAPTNMVGGGDIIQAIQGGGEGDVTKSHMIWNLDHKSPSNIASPLVVDGKVFMVKKGGLSAAFAAQDGATIFMKRRIKNLGNYYGSPVAAGSTVYVPAENGHIVVVKVGADLEILADNNLEDSLIATPAIADDRLFVRTLNKIFCFANQDQ
ncbi:MAG: PQQ-binding-like beta-propeller repeat protein [Planctomycetota bacterium]|nr:PQQ-binding-like beta-propeller repeat protein [Planctomycetota bacterium]MDA1178072.1 PQQ-binding-like beta-propeller repeat protein [Planctomycetota bacterium]